MNNKLTGLLTTAILTGLMASTAAQAEDKPANASGDMKAAEKNHCKGHANDKNGCKGETAKKKSKDKNACKNGCGEAKDNSGN